jgi:energy-coupling factor transporter transmembrane protein EcfT
VIRDPRAKLLITACCALGVLSARSVLFVLPVFLFYAVWTSVAEIPVRSLLRRVRTATLFLLVIVGVHGLTGAGRVVFETGGVLVTEEGLLKGAGQASRLLLVLWGAWLLVTTTRLEEFLDIAEGWGVRRGNPLLSVGIVAVNYLPLLLEAARRVAFVLRSRGMDPERGFGTTLAFASRAALPLFVASLRNADALADAMESRSYQPTQPRTPFRALHMNWSDGILTGCVVTWAAGAVVL